MDHASMLTIIEGVLIYEKWLTPVKEQVVDFEITDDGVRLLTRRCTADHERYQEYLEKEEDPIPYTKFCEIHTESEWCLLPNDLSKKIISRLNE